MKTSLNLALAGATLVFGAGCVSTSGRTVYSPAQVNQAMHVEAGTVIGVHRVVIDGQSSNVGTFGGGAMGAATTSGVGSGTGGAIATAAGGVAGMIVGREVEKVVTRKEGLEITIALDNGDTITVVQEEKKGGFQDGDRVRVLMGEGTATVMH